MDSDHPWNVLVPQQMWSKPSGFLLGSVDFDKGLVYISGTIGIDPDLHSLKTIGFWQGTDQNTNFSSATPDIKPGTCWVSLKLKHDQLFCSLSVKYMASESLVSKPVVCITFIPSEIMTSFILTRPHLDHGDYTMENERENKCCSKSQIGQQTECHRATSVCFADHNKTKLFQSKRQDFVISLKQMMENSSQHNHTLPDDAELFYNVPSRKKSKTTLGCPRFLLWIFCLFGNIIKTGSQGIKVCCTPLPRILQTPSTFQFLQAKGLLYTKCFRLDKSKDFNIFLLYNCYSQQLLDSCLGLAVIGLVSNYNIHDLAGTFVLDWADDVATQLSDLVQWLMGAPAGLKLNAQLTNFLGHFFIYHIYLWTAYLSLLRSVMPSVLWSCSLVGALGISAQLCLLRDLLSMLTLHIYCFYVYAAKIFSLQVYMLGSLWRLFRGKKWNVLRSRVDSAMYSTDQLFVGTLFFTFLLFLLPTTALYYAVFTLLRLAVLSVQGCLACVLDVIMTAPVFTLTMRLFRPKLVAGNVKFTVQNVLPAKNFQVLNMQTCQIPLKDLLKMTQPFLRPADKEGHTWLEFVTHLATGKLIYPWVEPHVAAQTEKKLV
ncbi:phosphatidylinositol n-acetylglucosaminyltransferase subunit q-like [Plakobranchus ocellatus]|uniref:Phosphatidylinositol n-acetylglucosaminyltransferase subunit q-like n=1 Tax=Plakobranchus ocellatus TaxID=259542 RepID=A0AAV3ZV16_9GAST|nr:phosphatidylinositol n-acetylglucosaminyltransferase subunit q-like [Plakobranchus ocellatus]